MNNLEVFISLTYFCKNDLFKYVIIALIHTHNPPYGTQVLVFRPIEC